MNMILPRRLRWESVHLWQQEQQPTLKTTKGVYLKAKSLPPLRI